MKGAVVLAIDMGTSSTRSAIYDGKAKRIVATTAQVKYVLQADATGRAELPPEVLSRALRQVLENTLKAWRPRNRRNPITAIGMSCFWHGLLGLDAAGRPVTPVYTWADSRCRDAARALRKRPGERRLHAQTGCMARTSFWPAKLLWLRTTDAALFRRVARWVSPAEWLQQTWCGAATVSYSMASGTGLLNGDTLQWHAPILRRCGVTAEKLNAISDEPYPVLPARARAFPELAEVAWYPAIGDGVASNLGSGATRPGHAAINVGTSAAVRVVVSEQASRQARRAPLGLFRYRVDSHRALLGGAVSNAGNLRAWARAQLQLPSDARIEKIFAAQSGPVASLTVLPFWLAERAPTWPEGVPSVVAGLTQATTALDLVQALQDATYLRLAQIAEELEKAAGRRLTFIVSGGIRHSPAALQMLADALGRPVLPSSEPEASLRGAACFVMGKFGREPATPVLGRAVRPQPGVARAYREARQRQVQLEAIFRNGIGI